MAPSTAVSAEAAALMTDDARFHPNLGGVTSHGMSNHFPMTIAALSELGADGAAITAWGKAWSRDKSRTSYTDLGLKDTKQVTETNWEEYLGRPKYVVELRRVFREILARDGIEASLARVLPTLAAGMPMGIYHPVIRLHFATKHPDPVPQVADALAYCAIRFVDMFNGESLEELPQSGFSPTKVWESLRTGKSGVVVPRHGGSIGIVEVMVGDPALHHAAQAQALPSSAGLGQAASEIMLLAERMYLADSTLTTLHAVTGGQALLALSHLVPAEVAAQLWRVYWVWLTGLYLEKHTPALPLADPQVKFPSWDALAAEARESRHVHVVKMAYTLRELTLDPWVKASGLKDTFETCGKIGTMRMIQADNPHPHGSGGLVGA